jgi:hypothetical protein
VPDLLQQMAGGRDNEAKPERDPDPIRTLAKGKVVEAPAAESVG